MAIIQRKCVNVIESKIITGAEANIIDYQMVVTTNMDSIKYIFGQLVT